MTTQYIGRERTDIIALSFEVDGKSDLRREIDRNISAYYRAVNQAQERAANTTARRARTIARATVRQSINLRQRSITRRIRVYRTKQLQKGGRFETKLWVGVEPAYHPLASSLKPPDVTYARRVRGERGRRITTILGSPVSGVFVPGAGRLRGRSVRRLPGSRRLETVRADVGPDFEAGFRKAARAIPDIYRGEYERNIRKALTS